MSWCLNVLNKPSNQDLLKTIFQNIDVPGVRKKKKTFKTTSGRCIGQQDSSPLMANHYPVVIHYTKVTQIQS